MADFLQQIYNVVYDKKQKKNQTHALEWGLRVDEGFLLVEDGSSLDSATRFVGLIDETDRLWVAFLAFEGSLTTVGFFSSRLGEGPGRLAKGS